MHSYLKTVGFSQITRRSEIKEIIRDVIASYDEKVCVENHPEGVFVQFSKNYATVESAFAGSMTRTVSFTWNIISHFSGEQESHPRKK
mgnify:CR=1 FL=1